VPWSSPAPQDLFIFIGVRELLGGVGLTQVIILAAIFHIMRGEYNYVPINVLPGGSPRSSRMDGCDAHRTCVDSAPSAY
jgi:hypothetical protein